MMKTMIAVLFLLIVNGAKAQISTVDIVKVKGQYEKEALYFYENNWKIFREQALEKKMISGFELVKSKADSTGVFAIVLVTRYADEATYAAAEKNFGGIIKAVSPSGPRMLNSVTRKDFIISTTGYNGVVLWRQP